jgi:hypothetical protein
MNRLECAFSAAVVFACSIEAADASFLLPERLGVRGGFSMDRDTIQFHQIELGAGYALPWSWEGKKFAFAPGIDASLGWLGDDTKDAMVISAGPEGKLTYTDWPVVLRFGSNPTYLSRFVFDQRDFGVEFQFTSHIGLSWDITDYLQVSYRLQHMSNAGFGTPNPGLNMHMIGIFWLF